MNAPLDEESPLLVPRNSSIDEFQLPQTDKTKSCLCFPVRYTIGGLIFFVMFTLYSQRTNLSTAIVKISDIEDWNDSMQGIVLSSFFWGYITTQLLGGILSSTFGAKPVLLVATLGSSIFNAILPFLADNVYLFLIVRMLSGVLQGSLYPTAHSAITAWFPPEERSTILGLAYSGSYLGIVVTMVISPVIIDYVSWQFSFWILSGLGFVWVAIWIFLGASTPADHPFISNEEVDFILKSRMKQFFVEESSVNTTPQATNAPLKFSEVPWTEIFKSPAVWAIIINNFTGNWGFYILFTWLPTYFSHELNFDMKHIGFVAPLPYLAAFLLILVCGRLADWARKKYDVATVRKFFQVAAQTISSIGMILLCFKPSHVMAVIYMIICIGGLAFTIGGMSSNHMDIGPRYAGILLGLSNTAGTIPGIVGVTLTGIILHITHSWSLVFIISIAVYSLGSIVFIVFAKGHVVLK